MYGSGSLFRIRIQHGSGSTTLAPVLATGPPPPGWPDTAPVRGDDITHLAGFLGRFFEPLVDSKVDIAVALQEGVYAGNKCLGGREEKFNIFYNDINPRTGTGTH